MSEKTMEITSAIILPLLPKNNLMPRGYLKDVDAVTEAGVYHIDFGTEGTPSNFNGILAHLIADSVVSVQVIIATNDLIFRVCWDGKWQKWKSVTTNSIGG